MNYALWVSVILAVVIVLGWGFAVDRPKERKCAASKNKNATTANSA